MEVPAPRSAIGKLLESLPPPTPSPFELIQKVILSRALQLCPSSDSETVRLIRSMIVSAPLKEANTQLTQDFWWLQQGYEAV